MNQLTEEQTSYIINEYGGTKELIEKLEKILNVHDFTEEEYFEIIIDLISEYETNNLKNSQKHETVYKSLKQIIEGVLKFKMKEFRENERTYNELENVIKKVKKIKSV